MTARILKSLNANKLTAAKKIPWATLSTGVILCLLLLCLLNWERFPLFVDIYYHLNVMRGFDAAGGIVDHAFWELAPAGTAHLYPPLFHLLLLIPYKMGFGILSIARFFSIASFLSLLATLSFVSNRLFSPKTGFFVTSAAVIPYTFFLKSTITVPVSLSLVFILLAFYALENKKNIACPLLISCAFYTHLGIPWLGVLAFLIYGIMKKDIFRRVLSAVLAGLLFSAPVIINILVNRHSLENPLGIRVTENELFEFYPFIYVFAVLGLSMLKDARIKERGIFFIAIFLGFLPLAFNYRYRFLSGEGLLPVIFFAGLGLEKTYDLLERSFSEKGIGRRLALPCFVSLFIVINIFSPTVSSYTPATHGQSGTEFFFRDSTVDNLLLPYKKHVRPFEINFVDPEAKEWAKVIKNKTAPDDIICSNYAYIGGMLSALTGRPNAARTFFEIKKPEAPINEFGSSKLAVFLRETDGNYDMAALKKLTGKYGFKTVAETDKAVVLLKDGIFKSSPTRPVVKTGIAFSALFCVFLFICYDLARPRRKFNSLSRSSLE